MHERHMCRADVYRTIAILLLITVCINHTTRQVLPSAVRRALHESTVYRQYAPTRYTRYAQSHTQPHAPTGNAASAILPTCPYRLKDVVRRERDAKVGATMSGGHTRIHLAHTPPITSSDVRPLMSPAPVGASVDGDDAVLV